MSSAADVKNEVAFSTGDRFRLLVEAVRDYAIFMLDPEGHILSWNAGAERIKGYRAQEVIGKHFSIFYTQEDAASGKPEMGLEIARWEGRAEDEGWRVRKDGSRFWAGVVITALRDEAGRIYGFGKVTQDLSKRKMTEDMLRRSIEQREEEIQSRIEAERTARKAEASVRDLSSRLQRLQDEERRRLARELHDSVGQLLAGMKMVLAALAREEGQRDGRAHILECEFLLEQAIREVRTMSYLFYPTHA